MDPVKRLDTKATREAGSAYLVVLLVLVVLTIFGLVLTLITQTEMQLGSNERTMNRVFYAADSGIEAATAKALVDSDYAPTQYTFTDSGLALAGGKLDLASLVSVSAFYPILEAPCNLCEINGDGSYQDRAYKRVNYAVTVQAARFATVNAGGQTTPLAQKTIATMVQIEPWRSPVDALKNIDNAAELQKVKF
jgi:type IV pilus assembly PilX-like protein